MKTLKATIALIMALSLSLYGQTNDPLLNQQYYIGAHNIDQVWNTTKGSSNTRIAIHSAMGFFTNHEDMNAGFHEVTFEAGSLSSGVYFAKLTAEGNSGKVFTKELKMQLVK